MGIVRGATQRLVKLELVGEPNDTLIGYLDSILAELQGGTARYGLPVPDDPAYLSDLSKLEATWREIKTEIANYRQGTGDSDRLLALSEAYFDQANNTVFSADALSLIHIYSAANPLSATAAASVSFRSPILSVSAFTHSKNRSPYLSYLNAPTPDLSLIHILINQLYCSCRCPIAANSGPR